MIVVLWRKKINIQSLKPIVWRRKKFIEFDLNHFSAIFLKRLKKQQTNAFYFKLNNFSSLTFDLKSFRFTFFFSSFSSYVYRNICNIQIQCQGKKTRNFLFYIFANATGIHTDSHEQRRKKKPTYLSSQ